MTVIWKYELKINDVQEIDIPNHANILDVQVQNGKPCIWARVNSDHPLRRTTIHTIATGQEFEYSNMGAYLGSYQLNNGELVFHVFVD